MRKNCAIILAAGKGKRMGANVNKQFLKLKGKPILYYTLEAFSRNSLVDEIVLVAAENEMEYCKKDIVEKYNINKVTRIVKGGEERQQSVLNGLRAIKDCQIVLIHDGARPFITDNIISDGIKYAKEYGACASGVMPKDTIKVRDDHGFSINTPDRNLLLCVQTPQCFKYDLILKCHEKISNKDIAVTDDTMVVEHFDHKVYLYHGSYNNIKITTPEDLVIADNILEKFL